MFRFQIDSYIAKKKAAALVEKNKIHDELSDEMYSMTLNGEKDTTDNNNKNKDKQDKNINKDSNDNNTNGNTNILNYCHNIFHLNFCHY